MRIRENEGAAGLIGEPLEPAMTSPAAHQRHVTHPGTPPRVRAVCSESFRVTAGTASTDARSPAVSPTRRQRYDDRPTAPCVVKGSRVTRSLARSLLLSVIRSSIHKRECRHRNVSLRSSRFTSGEVTRRASWNYCSESSPLNPGKPRQRSRMCTCFLDLANKVTRRKNPSERRVVETDGGRKTSVIPGGCGSKLKSRRALRCQAKNPLLHTFPAR